MTSFSFRALLLLSTSLLISGCDQSSETSQSGQDNQNASMEALSPYIENDTPPATLSGDFLAGQFAQDSSDWSEASDYFARILEANPDSLDIKRRAMALEMGAGHYDKALTLAKDIANSKDPDTSLARMILSLAAFKDGKYQDSISLAKGKEVDGISTTILPLITTWAEAAQGKADLSGINSPPSLIYQSVLVANYTKDKALLGKLAKTYDFTKIPTSVSRLEDIAAIFAANGETAAAKTIYEALKSNIPDRQKTYEAALQSLDNNTPISLPTSHNDTPQSALSEALFDMANLLSSGYPDSARLFAHMALFLNPSNNSALELLAEIAANNKLYDEAISFLSRIDVHGDEEREIRIIRQTAQLTKEAGQKDEAIRILSDLASSKKNVEAQILIGDIYREEDNFSDALKAYNKAYDMLGGKVTASYWELSFVRGMTNERLKNWDQAEKDLQTALLYEPDQPYVLNYLGYSWADQGANIDKAAEMIEKAVRLKPNDGAIVDSLGWVYFRMGEFEKASKTLEKAIELSPTEAEINDHLGDAYWRVGRKTEARFQWKRATSFSKDAELIKKIEDKIVNGLPDTQAATPAPTEAKTTQK